MKSVLPFLLLMLLALAVISWFPQLSLALLDGGTETVGTTMKHYHDPYNAREFRWPVIHAYSPAEGNASHVLICHGANEHRSLPCHPNPLGMRSQA